MLVIYQPFDFLRNTNRRTHERTHREREEWERGEGDTWQGANRRPACQIIDGTAKHMAYSLEMPAVCKSGLYNKQQRRDSAAGHPTTPVFARLSLSTTTLVSAPGTTERGVLSCVGRARVCTAVCAHATNSSGCLFC